jgi:WXG100 family type VII secretion target
MVMSEIKLRADEARDHAQDVKDSKEEAFDVLTGLRTRMDNLADSFTGRTHEAFMGKLDEWKSASDDLLEALFGLGEFLKSAADTIEQVDTDLAGQLGG